MSELLGSLLMIGITLVAGAAVFGWLNGELGQTANSYSGNMATNINYMNEKEGVPYAFFPTDSSISVWIQNLGSMDMGNYAVVVSGPFCPANSPACSSPTQSALTCISGTSQCSGVTATNPFTTVTRGSMMHFTLQLSSQAFHRSVNLSSTFTVTVTGQYGTHASYVASR